MAHPHLLMDLTLVQHCHAVLTGLKLANYFCVPETPEIHRAIERWSRLFPDYDLGYRLLCACHGKIGIYIYNHDLLARRLADPSTAAFLRQFGYGGMGPEEALDRLSTRLHSECQLVGTASAKRRRLAFPHEIGVFLGYPQPDVESFIERDGCDCLLIGSWKVYHDVKTAQRCFDEYKESLNLLRTELQSGHTLSDCLNCVRAEMARRRSL